MGNFNGNTFSEDVRAFLGEYDSVLESTLRYSGGSFGAEPEDFVQEAYLRVSRKCEAGQIVRDHGAFFSRSAKNVAVSHKRSQDVQKMHLKKMREMNGFHHPATPLNILVRQEGESRRQDLFAMVMDVIDGLPERDRNILVGFHLHEMSYEELSDKYGIPRPQVGMTLRRARKKVKKHFYSSE